MGYEPGADKNAQIILGQAVENPGAPKEVVTFLEELMNVNGGTLFHEPHDENISIPD